MWEKIAAAAAVAAASAEFLSNLFWNASCCLLPAALGLRLKNIKIPQYKFRGDTAMLECDYQLNGKPDSDDDIIENSNFNYHDHHQEVETLYSVKWYKDGEEFYRFVPKSNPPQNSYKGKTSFEHVDNRLHLIFPFLFLSLSLNALQSKE